MCHVLREKQKSESCGDLSTSCATTEMAHKVIESVYPDNKDKPCVVHYSSKEYWKNTTSGLNLVGSMRSIFVDALKRDLK